MKAARSGRLQRAGGVTRRVEADVRGQLRRAGVLVASGPLALDPSRFPVHPKLSGEAAATWRAPAVSDGSTIDAIAAEIGSVAESQAQVRPTRITTLGDIPPIVLSHGLAEGLVGAPTIPPEALRPQEEVWQEMRVDLAAVSSNGKRVVAGQSGHSIQLDQPDLVIDAIREVVEAARR